MASSVPKVKSPSIDLSPWWITNSNEIIHNPSYELLFEEETRPDLNGFERGIVTDSGAVGVGEAWASGAAPGALMATIADDLAPLIVARMR